MDGDQVRQVRLVRVRHLLRCPIPTRKSVIRLKSLSIVVRLTSRVDS